MWYEFPKLAASFSLWAAIRPTPILLGSCVTFLAPCPLALFQEWCVSDFLFLLFMFFVAHNKKGTGMLSVRTRLIHHRCVYLISANLFFRMFVVEVIRFGNFLFFLSNSVH